MEEKATGEEKVKELEVQSLDASSFAHISMLHSCWSTFPMSIHSLKEEGITSVLSMLLMLSTVLGPLVLSLCLLNE